MHMHMSVLKCCWPAGLAAHGMIHTNQLPYKEVNEVHISIRI